MKRRDRVASIPRWLLPVLVLVLVLGHACEWPAYALSIGSSHSPDGDHHHGHHGDHHADESQISCDAVDILSNTGSIHINPALGVVALAPVAWPAPLPQFDRSPHESLVSRSRPPLFLLHASLLI